MVGSDNSNSVITSYHYKLANILCYLIHFSNLNHDQPTAYDIIVDTQRQHAIQDAHIFLRSFRLLEQATDTLPGSSHQYWVALSSFFPRWRRLTPRGSAHAWSSNQRQTVNRWRVTVWTYLHVCRLQSFWLELCVMSGLHGMQSRHYTMMV